MAESVGLASGVLHVLPASRHTLHCYSVGRVFDVNDIQSVLVVQQVVRACLNTTRRTADQYCMVVTIGVDIQPRHAQQLGLITGLMRDAMGFEELAYRYGPEHPQARRALRIGLHEWAASLSR